MAEHSYDPGTGASAHAQYAVSPTNTIGKLTTFAGAAVSLALVVGVSVWGYKLLVRDVSGIPVVRAAAGEMRVRPEDPGGQLARHQGLSVNTVAAIGEASATPDQLRLAPGPVDLADEDQPMPQIAETSAAPEAAPVPQPEAAVATIDVDVAAALRDGSVEDLVAQLTDGVDPLQQLEAADDAAPVLASLSGSALSGEGLRASLRPMVRPARAAVPAAASPAARAATTTGEIDIASLPAGTRLVQLGAFDSPEIARAQWDKLAGQFAPFIDGKSRIVQQAKSGGRTFYRLRAHGFADIADARRFCSALVAESVDCIPVVTR
ncbi:SPOR domain-containing protein [Sulfitobacter albidus]|uniref:SPOR domain-containing protein n=1 Tax=Sulfitobacter albidus TaxID=2829501 RepID=A0A975JFY0_9RHOB|nr:SPOR domain-containing protein [Sulfitobacter albidus]QUJ77806.1 SPOR domain-containing protein [Sulfitobacter albidus]